MAFTSFNGHRAHDIDLLARRWSSLAKRAGLRLRRLTSAGDHPVQCVESGDGSDHSRQWIYLSAGVHGDEAAAPWGLLKWAESNIALLKSRRFLIFPCLNPHGIASNTRADHRGIDLNRTFHDASQPLIAAWQKLALGRPLSISLCLHEDYDAQGCYVYELTRRRGLLGRKILRQCSSIIPTDRRRSIDGRRAKDGVITRRVPPKLPGLPEAIVLHHSGCPVTLTFESPSEYSLLDRIAVQQRFIESALHHGQAL